MDSEFEDTNCARMPLILLLAGNYLAHSLVLLLEKAPEECKASREGAGCEPGPHLWRHPTLQMHGSPTWKQLFGRRIVRIIMAQLRGIGTCDMQPDVRAMVHLSRVADAIETNGAMWMQSWMRQIHPWRAHLEKHPENPASAMLLHVGTKHRVTLQEIRTGNFLRGRGAQVLGTRRQRGRPIRRLDEALRLA
jgi:hypothetical protein